jgi:type II secretion system protein I
VRCKPVRIQPVKRHQAGFTLLEVLVATVIMGIAVAGLMAGLSQSVRNASRLTDYDRAAMLARTKLNDLLLDSNLPFTGTVEGDFGEEQKETGWRASMKPFESQPNAGPGAVVLQEVALEVWWQPSRGNRRTLQLAGYRQARIPLPQRTP